MKDMTMKTNKSEIRLAISAATMATTRGAIYDVTQDATWADIKAAIRNSALIVTWDASRHVTWFASENALLREFAERLEDEE